MTVIEILEDLLRKATPGEWEWHGGLIAVDNEHIIWPRNAIEFGDTTPAQQIGACGERAEEDAEYNKALIVATHNALPAILTALRAAEALVSAHDHGHPIGPYIGALRSALAALGEGPREGKS